MFAWLKSLISTRATVLVSIPVADSFPNDEELEARNRITDTLDAQGIGKLVGAGGGFDQMDFEYKVADPDAAKQLIANVMKEEMPGQEYEVTVE